MKLSKPKLPPQIVGNAGLFYVCHKLSTLGWNAMPTSRNAAGVDVMCFSLDGTRKLLLQVKSLQKPDSLFMPHPDKIMGDYWVVVLGATGEKPTCYILKLEEVKSLVSKYAAKKDGKITYWLPKQLYAVEDYLEMWEQKIGFGAKKPTEEQPSDPLDDAQDDSEGNRQQEIPK